MMRSATTQRSVLNLSLDNEDGCGVSWFKAYRGSASHVAFSPQRGTAHGERLRRGSGFATMPPPYIGVYR
jgi:hypothetical protein